MENKKQIKMLNVAKGQIEGIVKMYSEDRYCIDISNQILATIAILKNINTNILTEHLSKCAGLDSANKDECQKLDEVVQIIKKLAK